MTCLNLWGKAGALPDVILFNIQEAIVEAGGAALPELYMVW